ncbi:hypothetical protein C8R45DRAFT_943020 [Mycena sanguinolenta]|nr:hypothetical protein C8R45DRAFT_943020 [Mycena sanguinolenta]
MFYHATLGTLAFLATAKEYVWPSPQLDALESARFDQVGHNANPPISFVGPRDSGDSGRSNAADWIRTAYHDMATQNSTDGTGGLNGFGEEQSRPDNAGDGCNNTKKLTQGRFTWRVEARRD